MTVAESKKLRKTSLLTHELSISGELAKGVEDDEVLGSKEEKITKGCVKQSTSFEFHSEWDRKHWSVYSRTVIWVFAFFF